MDYGAVKVPGIQNVEISGGNTPRILPRQLSSGSLRGNQTVGNGSNSVVIDSSNNRIVLDQTTVGVATKAQVAVGSLNPSNKTDKSFGLSITDTSGNSMSIGIGADGKLGITFADSDGFITKKYTAETDFMYDKSTKKNRTQSGKMPDGTYNYIAVNTGYDVADFFS